MTFKLNDFIKERIDFHIKNSDYVELDFQKKIIYDTVRFNIYTLSRYPMERAKVGIQWQFDMYEAHRRFVNLNNTPYFLDSLEKIYPMKFFQEEIFWDDLEDFNVLNDGTEGRPMLENQYTELDKTLVKNAKELWLEDELSKKADLMANFMDEWPHYPTPVVHLDVGMGKSFIGVLIMIITLETYLEVNKYLYSIIWKNRLFKNVKTKNPFENTQVKDFQLNLIIIPAMKREFEKMIVKLNLKKETNINFIKNSAKKDFEKELDPGHIFAKFYHQMGDMLAVLYIDWAYNFIKSNYDEEQSENFLLNSLIQWYGTYINDVEDLETDYADGVIDLETLKTKFIEELYRVTDKYTNLADLPLCIIDEFSSTKTPIYRDDKSFIELFQPFLWNWKHLGLVWVWLTASENTAIRPTIWFYSYTADYFSKFIEKKDVIKELIDKWLYKETWFLYKNIYMNNTKIEEYQEQLEKIKVITKQIAQLAENKSKDIQALIDAFNVIMHDFLKKEEDMINSWTFDDWKNLEGLLKNLEWIKIPLGEIINDNWLRDLVDNKEKLEEAIKNFKRDSFYLLNISDIIEDKWLVWLKDSKTIYLLDPSYKQNNPKALEDFVAWFKENEIHVFQVKGFSRDDLDKTLEKNQWEWIAIVGYIDEMWKWFNFQDFDNIVILYANQCSFDDIYQALGRIDRLGIDVSKQKEAIFIHFTKNEEFFDKLLSKRSSLAQEVKIEDYTILSDMNMWTINWTYMSVEKNLDNIKKVIDDNGFEKVVKTYKSKKGSIKLTDEQIENYQNTRDIVVDILKNISIELENQIKYISSIINVWNYGSKDTKLTIGKTNILEAIDSIKTVIWIQDNN